jgi:ribosomal protein L34E
MAPPAAQIELRFRHRALEELPTCLRMGKTFQQVPTRRPQFYCRAALIDH